MSTVTYTNPEDEYIDAGGWRCIWTDWEGYAYHYVVQGELCEEGKSEKVLERGEDPVSDSEAGQERIAVSAGTGSLREKLVSLPLLPRLALDVPGAKAG